MATSATEVSRAGYAHPEVLVDTAWVAAHRTDPKVKVVEVDVDTTAYEKGHVPGAIGLDWRKDLQAQPVRDLLPKDQFEALLSRHGISADDTIIAYGDNNNWFAAWFVWNLKYYGHRDVRLMDGGRKKWEAEGRELATDSPTAKPAQYRASDPNAKIRALRDDVRSRFQDSGSKLVDVRSPKEYSGELLAPENLPQEGAQRGGHIPGAANIPWGQAVREQRRHAGQAGDRLLPDRGALVAHLVRPPVPARIPERSQLRRVLDRVGQPDRGADRALANPSRNADLSSLSLEGRGPGRGCTLVAVV
jgi:thiosulfate/3-mercaptopyruvate sulfurtransferase